MSPFTETQSKELELQILIFNCLTFRLPIPSALVARFNRSLCSMSGGIKEEEDSEPGRCRRTDGKKWRCSNKNIQDSKYCKKHVHRGKKCPRKHVENAGPSSPFSTWRPSLGFSHPNTNTQLLLGSPPTTNRQDKPECYNFFSEHKEEEKPKHCYVLGADLMLGNPLRVEREEEVQKPKTHFCLFGERVET